MSENQFSCGPFTRGSDRDLCETLQRLGLRVTDDGAPPRIQPAADGGWRIEARGGAVRGYFISEDDEEAETQDVERLILACCLPDRELRLSGSAHVAPGRLLVIAAKARHDGRVVSWTSTRTVLGTSGKVSQFKEAQG